MAVNPPGAVLLAVSSFLLSSPAGFSFQSNPQDAPVAITPRPKPVVRRADSAGANPTTLRVDATLALIPTHVATQNGAPVTDLQKEDFRIFEEGVEQEITYFAQDDAALSIGLLFDSSASMKDKKQKAAEAALAFFNTATLQDEFFLVEFDDRPNLSVPFTPDSNLLYDRIRRVRPFGRTSLLDAIDLALTQMKTASNPRKALVILSDGADNRSRHTFSQIKNRLLESDVQLYAMGIFAAKDDHKPDPEELSGPDLLDDLARESGGTHHRVASVADLPQISQELGRELRSQYILGYSPLRSARDGKYRRVQIELRPQEGVAPLSVRYRRGYYALQQ